MGFIVGLNRDRDSYQVPLAIAEVGQLDAFVTDYYEGVGIGIPSLRHRRNEGISPSKVIQSHRAFLAQIPYEVQRRIKKSVDFPSSFVEKNLGKTIAAVARKNPDSDLLLYSGSALWAFEEADNRKKILFQYHPSPAFIVETLKEIDELATFRPWQEEAEAVDSQMQETHAREVALADSAICASTFTKRGLIAQGMSDRQVQIAPYGGPVPESDIIFTPTKKVQFLFVGQGVARKGLHILVEAWRRANLKNSEITVVTSRLDPVIEDFARGISNFNMVGRVGRPELLCLMIQADTFVLPSLVEGYGLVLGEALAHGCRLIASTNTGLTDMKLPGNIGCLIEAGRIEPLVSALQEFEATAEENRSYQQRALAEAERLSWENFRKLVRQATGTQQ